MTFGYKARYIKISEFVGKTQFLCVKNQINKYLN